MSEKVAQRFSDHYGCLDSPNFLGTWVPFDDMAVTVIYEPLGQGSPMSADTILDSGFEQCAYTDSG
jgi:hypothetical protein